MSERAIIGGRRGAWAATLLAFALLLRIAVPAGWMPAADGSLSIVPCYGFAPPAAPIAHSGGHHGSPKPHHAPEPEREAPQPCVFLALGAAVTPPDPILPALPSPGPIAQALVPAAVRAIPQRLAAPPPPSTGPPRAG